MRLFHLLEVLMWSWYARFVFFACSSPATDVSAAFDHQRDVISLAVEDSIPKLAGHFVLHV